MKKGEISVCLLYSVLANGNLAKEGNLCDVPAEESGQASRENEL